MEYSSTMVVGSFADIEKNKQPITLHCELLIDMRSGKDPTAACLSSGFRG